MICFAVFFLFWICCICVNGRIVFICVFVFLVSLFPVTIAVFVSDIFVFDFLLSIYVIVLRGNQMGNYRGCSNISNVFVEVMADIYFIFHINMLTQWLTALPIQLVPQCLKFCNLRSRVNNVHILTGQYFLVKLYLFTTKLIYLGYSYHPYLAICVRSTR